MSPVALEPWLRQRLRRDAFVCLTLGPLAIAGGLLALFLTFWLAYAFSWIVGRGGGSLIELLGAARWRPDHRQCLWGATGFTGLLVFTHLRGPGRPADLGDYPAGEPTLLGEALARTTALSPTSLLLLQPGYGARMIVDLLLTGPRLVHGGVRLLREGMAKFGADVSAGAHLLGRLQVSPGKVPYADLSAGQDVADLRAAMLTLWGVSGVIFLEQGMTLAEELRAELAARSGTPAND